MARPSPYPSVGLCSSGCKDAFLFNCGDVLNCKWSSNRLWGGDALMRIDINRHNLKKDESANPGDYGGKEKSWYLRPPPRQFAVFVHEVTARERSTSLSSFSSVFSIWLVFL